MTNPKVKACIFDVDGTLAETETLHLEAFNQVFSEFQLNWIWDQILYKQLLQIAGSKNRINYFNNLSKSKLSNNLIREILERKNRLYIEKLQKNSVKVCSGVKELVNLLKNEMKLAVATSTSKENVDALILKIWGEKTNTIFSAISTPEEYTKNKPAPDLYINALKKLSLKPHQVIAIEDSEIGLKSAKAAKIKTVVVPSIYTQGSDFSNADLLVSDLFDPRVKVLLGVE